MDNSTTALVKQFEGQADQMALWSDDKRKDFVSTFNKRVEASEYILEQTAQIITQEARRRQYLSAKHNKAVEFTRNRYHYRGNGVGNRDASDLDAIAQDQAKSILKSLPPLKKAVQIIDPDTSQMIIDKEKMEVKGQKMLDQLKEVGGDLDLNDLDSKTTIGELQALVKKRERTRRSLVNKLDELGDELHELDKKICKKLYAGIPGLSEAVISAVKNCIEKSKAIGQMGRRVEERVMFGDSEAAMEILHGFEKDEVSLSNDIKQQFDNAMKALKLKAAPKKAAKRLTKGTKKRGK